MFLGIRNADEVGGGIENRSQPRELLHAVFEFTLGFVQGSFGLLAGRDVGGNAADRIRHA